MTPALVDEMLDLVFDAVNMKHVKKDEIKADTPLMAGGLGLDSIDVLEVVIALEKRYNIKIENNDNSRKIFQTVGTLAEYIQTQQNQTA